ncbi:MAG: ubiquitin-like small modifier protein 1 [Haloarculaceae archaeon]
MELELRFFANFREAVGQKTITREFEGETVTVADAVDAIESEFPEIEILDEDGALRDFVRTLRNGREVAHLEGLETVLDDGDTLSIFPPVAGG